MVVAGAAGEAVQEDFSEEEARDWVSNEEKELKSVEKAF